MSIVSKLGVLYNSLEGYWQKTITDLRGTDYLPNLRSCTTHNDIIVSLTSYGRRVSDGVVYYTLVSMLNQKVLPKKVILWLDQTKWNNENIPTYLKDLRDNHGIEIEFCEDVRSYTKLIYSIQKYPNDSIVTIDDDIIYSPLVITELEAAHKKNISAIIGFNCLKPTYDELANLKTYRQWDYAEDGECSFAVYPLGYETVLYPPKSLHTDAFDKKLFQKYCPQADDIWFYIQAIRNGTQHLCIVDKKVKNYSFDALYQYFHRGSALMHTNVSEHANDKQIADTMRYYGMDINLLH